MVAFLLFPNCLGALVWICFFFADRFTTTKKDESEWLVMRRRRKRRMLFRLTVKCINSHTIPWWCFSGIWPSLVTRYGPVANYLYFYMITFPEFNNKLSLKTKPIQFFLLSVFEIFYWCTGFRRDFSLFPPPLQQNFIFLPFVMRMMTSMIMACVLFCLSINTPSLALFAVSLSVRLSYSQVKRRLPNVWMVRVVSLTNPVQISSLHHQQTRQMFVFGIRQDSLALVPSLRLNSTKIVSDKPLVNLADALRPPRQIHLSVTQKRNFFLIL